MKAAARSIITRNFWIFDLDGTLTMPVHDFPQIRENLGIPAGEDILKYIIGQDNKATGALLAQLDTIEKELAEMTSPAKGALELISVLAEKEARLGIITRNTRENARRSLEKMGILPFFAEKCILGRMQAPAKPDPAGIFQLLELWNTTPEQAVMVGDYLFDLQAGKSAGTATIHVSQSESQNWDELTDIRVLSLADIVNMFKSSPQ